MRVVISFIVLVFFAFSSFAQVKDPVKWTAYSRKKAGGYEVVLNGYIAQALAHLFSKYRRGRPGGNKL